MNRKVLTFFLLTGVCVAQVQPQISGEELRLLDAFRANPAPYRAILYGSQPDEAQAESPAAGRRTDIVQVGFVGGKVSFIGRNGRSKKGFVRIARGGTAIVPIGRDDDSAVSQVSISFTNAGVVLEWPDTPRGDGKGLSRTTIQLPEGPGWTKGDVVRWTGPIDSVADQAEELILRVRYLAR